MKPITRWKHLPYPNQHKLVSDHDGDWVSYEDHCHMINGFINALDPNLTKADYMGEIEMPVVRSYIDDEGDAFEVTEYITVSWDTIKDIMKIIIKQANNNITI